MAPQGPSDPNAPKPWAPATFPTNAPASGMGPVQGNPMQAAGGMQNAIMARYRRGGGGMPAPGSLPPGGPGMAGGPMAPRPAWAGPAGPQPGRMAAPWMNAPAGSAGGLQGGGSAMQAAGAMQQPGSVGPMQGNAMQAAGNMQPVMQPQGRQMPPWMQPGNAPQAQPAPQSMTPNQPNQDQNRRNNTA